jgi:hypothetical protein
LNRRDFFTRLIALPLAAAGAALAVKAHTASKAAFDASPYLTSKDAWFLTDYPGKLQRYSVPADWRGIYGSSGA